MKSYSRFGEWTKYFGIYAIVNDITGIVYIGSTSTSYRKRFNSHIHKLGKGNHENLWLQRAWNKYGKDNFSFIEIERIEDKETIPIRERYWINHYKSLDLCCNLKLDTERPRGAFDIETARRKSSESHKKWYASLSSEDKKKISELHKTISSDPQWRANISKANKEYSSRDEVREYRSRQRMEIWKDPIKRENMMRGMEKRFVRNYSFVSPDGYVYSIIGSIRRFAREMGLYDSGLRLVYKGLQKQHKGWTYLYNDGWDVT